MAISSCDGCDGQPRPAVDSTATVTSVGVALRCACGRLGRFGGSRVNHRLGGTAAGSWVWPGSTLFAGGAALYSSVRISGESRTGSGPFIVSV